MRIFSIIFILFVSLITFGNISEKDVVIKWEKTKKIKNPLGEFEYVMSFHDAFHDLNFENLPAFLERLPLNNYNDIVEVSLEDKVFASLTNIEEKFLSDKNIIAENILIDVSKTIDRKKPFTKILILPFRKNPGNGDLEKLISFKLKINITKSNQKNSNKISSHAYESVLNTGDWYKIRVNNSGIHKISYDDLLEMGIDVASVDPRKISLFGNGNAMLSERNSVERTDDLLENAIFVSGEEDGSFDAEDYILFYGEEAVQWKYNPFKVKYDHVTNLYSDYTFYYLTTNAGAAKRIEEINTSTLVANKFVDLYNDFVLHELENTSLINSGKEWYGEDFSTDDIKSFDFDISGIDVNEEATLEIGYAIRSNDTSSLKLFCEGNSIGYTRLPPSLGSSNFAYNDVKSFDFYPTSGLEINVQFNPVAFNSTFWLDYLEINFTRDLAFEEGQLDFSNIHITGSGNVAEYRIANVFSPLEIWDVSNKFEIKKIDQGIIQNDTFAFVSEAELLHQFIAFDGTLFFDADFVGKVNNQNLHSFDPVDMIYVTHPKFLDFTEQLAVFHESNDNLSYVVATTDQVFNEFSCGTPDPTAIRDFVKMLYDRADSSNLPRYLLLFGDGNFDPKNRNGSFENYVPTFQSAQSLKITASFVSDDYFGLMDVDEGYDANGSVDIGVGRISVSTAEQASGALNKIFSYYGKRDAVFGDWRNKMCFVADDQDNNMHIRQSEEVNEIIDTAHVDYNLKKIYLDAYEQISVPSGNRYPDVTKAINRVIDEGALVINYTGHGGELGWSDEKVIDIPLINSWDNFDKLPFFLTATCEFSRFDNPELLSGGECLFLNPNGGAIAMFTTTRLSYATTNTTLNKKFFLSFFNKEKGEHNRIGDLVRISKTPSNINIKNFVLLGDPALHIALPDYKISTTSITKENAKSENDTISAKDKITISGFISNENGDLVSDFNGIIYTDIFDKVVENTTLGNDFDSYPKIFYTRENVLNKSKAGVVNGEFSFSFYIPRDINFEYGEGKISYYAYDTITYNDANGYTNVTVGGINNSMNDDEGPEIELYLNDKSFVSGDIVKQNSLLLVDLFDEQGINYTGNGIGHDIVAVIDDNYSKSVILDKYFEPTLNDFRSGTISYKLDDLSFGYHNLKLKVWDVFNNSSEASFDFYIDGSTPNRISNIINFPNPVNEGTYFQFDHDFEDLSLDVQVLILNTYGNLIKSFSGNYISPRIFGPHYSIAPIYWDGRDENGSMAKSGVYIYKLLVSGKDNKVAAGTGKLIVIR